MKRLILLCLIMLIFTGLQAQDKGKITNGIEYIYHLKFDSAKTLFSQYINENPKRPEGYFFDAMVDWWQINLDKTNESYDERFMTKIDKVIDVCDNALDVNENDANAQFYKGGALGYRGLVRSIRENWLKAANDGKQALDLIQEASKSNTIKDVSYGIGLYNYFADYIPERYPVVKPLMLIFPKGDKQKGLDLIKNAASSGEFTQTEAKYILVYLYHGYEKNYSESEKYANELVLKYPENPIFAKYLYSSYVGSNKLNAAIQGWKTIIDKFNKNEAGYTSKNLLREANYYTGFCMIKTGDANNAIPYLLESQKISEDIDKDESAFKVFTYLMLGMGYDKIGDRNKALEYYNKVIQYDDKEFESAVNQAQKYISSSYK